MQNARTRGSIAWRHCLLPEPSDWLMAREFFSPHDYFALRVDGQMIDVISE